MKKEKLLINFLILCITITALTGCIGVKAPTNEQEENQNKIIHTDSVGRQIELPENIINFAPSGTMAQMILFPLAPEMFVGMTGEWNEKEKEYIDPKYHDLPIIGQFYGGKNLNFEEIARVNPQVIIDIGEAKGSVAEDMDEIMEQVKIPTIHITATLDSVPEAYRSLGRLLKKEEEGEVLAQYCESVLERTKEVIAKVKEEEKVKLLYLAGEDGLNVISKDSFHAEILDQVAENLAILDTPTNRGIGDPVSMEQIALWNPDVIIFAPNSAYNIVADDPVWQKLKAVKEGKFYEVPGAPYNWMGNPPSVNRFLGMTWVIKLLYPEIAQFDAYEEIARYYELFYHRELDKEKYEELVANSLLKK